LQAQDGPKTSKCFDKIYDLPLDYVTQRAPFYVTRQLYKDALLRLLSFQTLYINFVVFFAVDVKERKTACICIHLETDSVTVCNRYVRFCPTTAVIKMARILFYAIGAVALL